MIKQNEDINQSAYFKHISRFYLWNGPENTWVVDESDGVVSLFSLCTKQPHLN